jgi:hypothetical protein
MRTEGHTALVHTAAASSLGIMLNKVCIKRSRGQSDQGVRVLDPADCSGYPIILLVF